MSEPRHNLVFHTQNIRRTHGCLPLYFLMAALVLGLCFAAVKVVRNAPLRPKGVGTVYDQTDLQTRFRVQQQSIHPLLLPSAVDVAPDARELPLKRSVAPMPMPSLPLYPVAPDSAALNAESLLELPPAEETTNAPH